MFFTSTCYIQCNAGILSSKFLGIYLHKYRGIRLYVFLSYVLLVLPTPVTCVGYINRKIRKK